jgi:hypothetical protein
MKQVRRSLTLGALNVFCSSFPFFMREYLISKRVYGFVYYEADFGQVNTRLLMEGIQKGDFSKIHVFEELDGRNFLNRSTKSQNIFFHCDN